MESISCQSQIKKRKKNSFYSHLNLVICNKKNNYVISEKKANVKMFLICKSFISRPLLTEILQTVKLGTIQQSHKNNSLIPYHEKSVYKNQHATLQKHMKVKSFFTQTSTIPQSVATGHLENTLSLITLSSFAAWYGSEVAAQYRKAERHLFMERRANDTKGNS